MRKNTVGTKFTFIGTGDALHTECIVDLPKGNEPMIELFPVNAGIESIRVSVKVL